MADTTQRLDTVRMPPQSLEAEAALLGSLLLDKEAIWRVVDILEPKDFYKAVHRAIYEAALEVLARREAIDVLSISNRLKEKSQLDEIGGMSYLASLVNTVPTASSAGYYARIVHRKRIHRDLIEASHRISELGYKEEEDIEKILDDAEKTIFSVAQSSLSQEFLPVKRSLEEAWQRIEKLHAGEGALRGVSTGFADLDNILAGLQRSDMIVLAARPSLGKTSLALDIARNVALKENLPVGFFSIEMSQEQVIDRLIASQAGVDLWRLRTGRLSDKGEDNDFVRIRDAMETLSKTPLYIDDVSSPTVMQIRAMARRLQAEHGALGLVVVDYLQLIRGHDNAENRVQEVSEISRALKAMAKELDVPVLALSQLSRAVEMRPAGRPKLSDLRESGSIEQDSDVVMFIYREDKVKENTDKKNIAEILIEKHRNGPTGKIQLYFNEEIVSFRSIAKHFEEESEI
ncbi:MAG: replicative DNA helicase [Candidatus Sungbacteria bacterium]|nr:replicative DNA helicase [Candidatus Sungbacteria bacterium]